MPMRLYLTPQLQATFVTRQVPAYRHLPRFQASSSRRRAPCRRTHSSSSLSFKPKPVKKRVLDTLTAAEFLAYIQKDIALEEPIHFIRRKPLVQQHRTLIDILLDDPGIRRCIVDLEIGRYDKCEEFQQVQLPLAAYLEWLKEGREGGMMGGKPVYLAQWRGLEEVRNFLARTSASLLALSEGDYLFLPKAFQLETYVADTTFPAVRNQIVDLYQSSFFVGPGGAVTPLHHDPYINLFSLVSSSDWREATKHFLILPPSDIINKAIRPAASEGQANTSPLDFRISRNMSGHEESASALSSSELDNPEMQLTETSPSRAAIHDIRQSAWGVTLRAGEMLLLPYKWWHRVENVGATDSWAAGIGYWMRLRSCQTGKTMQKN